MEILFLLIPLSVVLAFAIAAAFAWAIDSGQFEDLEQHGRLALDEPATASELDLPQTLVLPEGAPPQRVDTDQAPPKQSAPH